MGKNNFSFVDGSFEKVHYEKNKFNSNKETIVFIHGLTGHSGVWKNYFKELGRSYNVLKMDLIGHGKSIRPYSFSKYSPNFLAKEILGILKKEKIKKANFVCHSYSFMIALELSEMAPEIFKSAIFISPYFPDRKTFLWKLERLLSFPLGALVYFLPTKKNYRIKEYAGKDLTNDFDFKRIIDDTLQTGIKSYVALNYHSLKYNRQDLISKINFPTLFISGREDNIIHFEDVEKLAHRVKRSKIIGLKNRAHVLVFPFYREIIPLIKNFMKKI
jgi:pimeloyl-ACP methyl ester carboxylesterase